MNAAGQLSFDLPARQALGREDFFVSPANALAVAMIESWQDWPGGKLVLTGPAGSGKTHLVHVWAASVGASVVPASDLSGADIARLADGPVAVDGAGPGKLDIESETALFHLHNLAAANRVPLMVTARVPPRDWRLHLPDLASRLQAAQTVTMEPPDDSLFHAVLMKHFADRQLSPTPDAVTYLVRRLPREFRHAAEAVARIDRASLDQKRNISRSLARDVLDKWDNLSE